MRARLLGLGATIGVLASLLSGSCATGKAEAASYVSAPDEELYGTFLYPDRIPGRSVNTPGRWTDYVGSSGSQVFAEGTEKIFKKWTDSSGDVWVQTYAQVTSCGPAVPGHRCYDGAKVQTLNRFDRGGKVREWVLNVVPAFGPTAFPTKIDPKNGNYHIAYRSTD